MSETDPFEKFEELAEKSGTFQSKGFFFVLAAIDHARKMCGREGHITGQELCRAAKDLAIRDFGPAAKLVLNGWGIHSTLDIGRIVYLMIDAELLSKTDEDSIDDFRDAFDFDTEFVQNYRY